MYLNQFIAYKLNFAEYVDKVSLFMYKNINMFMCIYLSHTQSALF